METYVENLHLLPTTMVALVMGGGPPPAPPAPPPLSLPSKSSWPLMNTVFMITNMQYCTFPTKDGSGSPQYVASHVKRTGAPPTHHDTLGLPNHLCHTPYWPSLPSIMEGQILSGSANQKWHAAVHQMSCQPHLSAAQHSPHNKLMNKVFYNAMYSLVTKSYQFNFYVGSNISTSYQHALSPPKPPSVATLAQVPKVICCRTTLPTIAKHPLDDADRPIEKWYLVCIIHTSDKGYIQQPLFQPLTPFCTTNLFTKHDSTMLRLHASFTATSPIPKVDMPFPLHDIIGHLEIFHGALYNTTPLTQYHYILLASKCGSFGWLLVDLSDNTINRGFLFWDSAA